MKAEQASKLAFDAHNREQFDPSKLLNAWYLNFTALLFDGVRKAEIDSVFENMSFIVFNYDRCVEYYLYHSLQNYYGVTSDKAAQLLQTLTILHPYGDVGGLPWRGVPFGGRPLNRSRIELAMEIKTFTESLGDQALATIRQEIQQAETLVFLSFAFDELNMELLTSHEESRVKRLFGTAKGISDPDLYIITHQIQKMLRHSSPGNVTYAIRNTLSCNCLFHEFKRQLLQAG